jgi:HD superfamily phosphodiesterase
MTDKDRYELKIAGLLHDCGKVTTPVHVVDKATKLQTLFDRIHLIDTRFEVLKRDAEIALLKAQRQLDGRRGRRLSGQLEEVRATGSSRTANSCAGQRRWRGHERRRTRSG